MGYELDELEKLKEKNKFKSPEDQKASEKIFRLADQRLEYGLRILGAAHWWLGWRGALMGNAILTDNPEIPTACVGFNRTHSKMDYYFNVWFAASLSPGDVAFVIGHEALHIVLGHVDQIELYKIQYPEIWNIICDAFINELLRRTLKWSEGMPWEHRQDWTVENGIYYKDLPKAVREKYPADAGVAGEVNIERTCLELYLCMIEDMESKGIDPNEFQRQIERKSFGAEKKRKKKIEREEGSSEEVVHQKVYVEPGDIVFVKTKETYGIIEKLRRIQDQEGEADIFYADDITQPEWVWLSRAVGITTKIGKKSFPMSRKIVETFAKMKAAGMRPMTWGPFAKALGIPEIEELDEIDRQIKERDAADAAEIAAEEAELERKLAADAARDAGEYVDPEELAPVATAPGGEVPALATPGSPSDLAHPTPPTPEPEFEPPPSGTGKVDLPTSVPPPDTVPAPASTPAAARTPLLPKIVKLQEITAQKGPVPIKPSARDYQRQVEILAATAMEDFTFGPTELFKTPDALNIMVNWLLRLQAKR